MQAKDLPARDSNGASDPYIIVCLNNQKAKTAVRAATLTPVWEHRMIFRVGCDAEQEKLILKVELSMTPPPPFECAWTHPSETIIS